MSYVNGKGNWTMSASPCDPPHSLEPINMATLKLWVLCLMGIIGFGVASYILNWWIGNPGH
jgi:hypothetical protein